MVLLVCAGGILLLLGMYLHLHVSIFIVYNTVLAGVFLLDLKISPQQKDFTIHRKYDDVFEIGKEKNVSLCIFNASGRAVVMQLKDTVPVDWKQTPSLITLNCSAGQDAAGHYTVCPNKRGSYALGNIFVRYSGVLVPMPMIYNLKSKEQRVNIYPLSSDEYHLLKEFLSRKDQLTPNKRAELSQQLCARFFEKFHIPLEERKDQEKFLHMLAEMNRE